jgi:succinoglycan biosynthesis protein ExoH
VLRFAAPLLVWPAASLLVATPVGRWMIRMSRYSFFIFVAHAPVLLATSIVYKRYQLHVPYQVYWIVAPVVTIAILAASYKLLARFVPGTFGLAVGTRNIRRRQPDTAVPARIAGGLD